MIITNKKKQKKGWWELLDNLSINVSSYETINGANVNAWKKT